MHAHWLDGTRHAAPLAVDRPKSSRRNGAPSASFSFAQDVPDNGWGLTSLRRLHIHTPKGCLGFTCFPDSFPVLTDLVRAHPCRAPHAERRTQCARGLPARGQWQCRDIAAAIIPLQMQLYLLGVKSLKSLCTCGC